jgi:hypothetical protein
MPGTAFWAGNFDLILAVIQIEPKFFITLFASGHLSILTKVSAQHSASPLLRITSVM